MAPGPACGPNLSRTHRIAGVRCLLVSGDTHGNPVTDGALLVGALGVEILLLAMLLPSLPLPRLAPLARILNLVAPLLAITGMCLVPHRDPDDHFFTVVVMMPLVAIFLLAWTWRPALPAERT